MYNWEVGITELVKAEFVKIAKKRMRGIVSQARHGNERPIWIGPTLWEEMWKHWDTPEVVAKSSTASRCRNSDRGGLGMYKHNCGQKSFLQIQQEMVNLYPSFHTYISYKTTNFVLNPDRKRSMGVQFLGEKCLGGRIQTRMVPLLI